MKKNTAFRRTCGIILIFLCLALTLGVELIFPACGAKEDGSYMNCHNAQTAVAACGAVMTLLAVLSIVSGRRTAMTARILILPIAVLAMLLPQTIIHMCMMADMQCRAVMRPCVLVISALILIVSAVSLAAEYGKKDGK